MPEEKKDDRKWGWSTEDAGYGPFDSREEAIKNAAETLNPDGEIEVAVGRCQFADPVKYLPTDVDEMLENLDMKAADGEYGFWEDEIFDVEQPEEEAQKALTEVLENWAKKYVSSVVWILVDEQMVTIGGPTKE